MTSLPWHWHSNAMRDRDTPSLPVGKLPPEILARLLAAAPVDDPRVLVGPGVGLDCAVIDLGEQLLVCKSDPVTFATDQLGAYLVQVNANDLATTGATPSWLLVTLLLPENAADEAMAERLMAQIGDACRELGIALVGGHTEITYGLDRPVAVGTLLGLVARDRLVTPRGAQPGDRLLLTKSVPIEATAILARERSDRLGDLLTDADLSQAQGYLNDPGIGVTRDARIALDAGRVTAMHDPTEGGLATALWELAQASGQRLAIRSGRGVGHAALGTGLRRLFHRPPHRHRLGSTASHRADPGCGAYSRGPRTGGHPLHGDRRGHRWTSAGPATDPVRLGAIPPAEA